MFEELSTVEQAPERDNPYCVPGCENSQPKESAVLILPTGSKSLLLVPLSAWLQRLPMRKRYENRRVLNEWLLV